MSDVSILIKLTVDANTRKITIPNNGTIFGVVGDIEINRVMFSVPRYYSGFDMKDFVARVNYVNPNGELNFYESSDVTETEDTVTFTWLMGSDVTKYVGDVKFSIKLYKVSGNTYIKSFNTTTGVGKVLDGLDVEKQITSDQQTTLLGKLEADIRLSIDEYVNNKVTENVNSYIDKTVRTKVDSVVQEELAELKKDSTVQQVNTNASDIADIKSGIVAQQNTQPTKDTTQIWVDTSDAEEIEIPEMSEFNSLKEETDLLKGELGKYYISHYITDETGKVSNGAYDVTDIVDDMLNNGTKRIIIDIDSYISHPIVMDNGMEISGERGSILYFQSGSGFTITKRIENASIHDLNISGFNVKDTDSDKWLIDIGTDTENIRFFNMNLINGYNGIRVNGWVNNYTNFRISYFKGIGLYIGRSDNTFNTFYINGCEQQGLYMNSSNNRIENIKILTCGKECESVYLRGSRNTITNIEIQDIFKQCAKVEVANNNIIDINFDGIRTNLKEVGEVILADFINSSYNIIRVISSKYGGGVSDKSNDDLVHISQNCTYNKITASLLKVDIKDEGKFNDIVALKKTIIKYDFNAIRNLKNKYESEELSRVLFIECDDVTEEYSGYVYCFKNSGSGSSGIRFNVKDENIKKVFAVVLLETENKSTTSNAVAYCIDQQNNDEYYILSPNTYQKECAFVVVGSDNTHNADWCILNTGLEENVTKIKELYLFTMDKYGDVLKDIII